MNKQKKCVSRWQLVEPAILSETVPSNSVNLHQGRSQGGGSWGARDAPFCKPFLTKRPTTGGENAMTISWP